MKKFIKGFLAFVIVCAVIGYFVGYFMSSLPVLTYISQTFLVAVSNNQYQQAYLMLTPSFQQRTNLETFKSTVQSTHLDKYKNVTWVKNEIYAQDNTGIAIGIITTADDTKMAVEFQFSAIGVQSKDKRWMINNIRFPQEYNDNLKNPQANPQVKPQG